MLEKYLAVRIAFEKLMENASKVHGQNMIC